MILCAKTDNRGRGGERACPEDIITKPYWGGVKKYHRNNCYHDDRLYS